MPKLNPNLFFDEDYQVYADRHQHRQKKFKPNYQPKRAVEEVVAEIADGDERDRFDFSYNASRHERVWIIDSLGNFYDEHWLDDVLRLPLPCDLTNRLPFIRLVLATQYLDAVHPVRVS